jgi:hypothetical protein
MLPTREELKIAEHIAGYQRSRGQFDVDECRAITEWLAGATCHEGATWKNRVLFHLTGADKVCQFKNS